MTSGSCPSSLRRPAALALPACDSPQPLPFQRAYAGAGPVPVPVPVPGAGPVPVPVPLAGAGGAFLPFPFFARVVLVPHSDDDRSDLNIGWLSSDHAYRTQEYDRRLVRALLRCCMRPERLCRGYHVCDLGCKKPRGYGPLIRRHQGREVCLGNGEVRVVGSDEQRFAAPTLVAHYVAAHGYAPPEAFVEGVMRRAGEIRVLRGDSVKRLRAMAVADRFALCMSALETLQKQQPNPWLVETLEALRAAEPVLDSQRPEPCGVDLARVRELARSAAPEGPLAVATSTLAGFFVWLGPLRRHADSATLDLAVRCLEQSHEAGLLNWRDEMTPSRWDRDYGPLSRTPLVVSVPGT